MAEARVDDELWNEFHELVNMSSRELSEWLRTRSADRDTEPLPDRAGPPTGQQVLAILRKRRTDLDAEDVRVMRGVVAWIRNQRRDDLEPTQGDADWRHQLMSVGHDPLKVP